MRSGEIPNGPWIERTVRSGWRVESLVGTAAELHAAPVEPGRTVRVHIPVGRAVVLGSTQSDGSVAGSSPGVEVARRRSGGGAVWLAPGEQVWVDLVIPAGDPLWDDDVGRAAHWVGECWARLVGPEAEVWRGPMERRSTGAVACFAGLGPGEVVSRGRKVVGISQRRTSRSARFQCVAYLRWDPTPLIEALGPVDPAVVSRLAGWAGALPAAVVGGGEWGVVERLLRGLLSA